MKLIRYIFIFLLIACYDSPYDEPDPNKLHYFGARISNHSIQSVAIKYKLTNRPKDSLTLSIDSSFLLHETQHRDWEGVHSSFGYIHIYNTSYTQLTYEVDMSRDWRICDDDMKRPVYILYVLNSMTD